MAKAVPSIRPVSANLVAGHIICGCSRAAVRKVTRPPSVSKGPGTNSGKTIRAMGATNIVKPTPPTPCKKAEPVISAAIKAKDHGLIEDESSAMCALLCA